jgi:hypothetical protein
MAQYKSNCTTLKKEIAAVITQVSGWVKSSGPTAAQKKIMNTLLTAMKSCQTAVNKCDSNCSCKGKTPTAGMQCFAGPVSKANAAINAYNTAIQKSG